MVELNEFRTEIISKDVLNDIEVGTINQKYYTLPQSRAVVSTMFPDKVLRLSRNEIFNTADLKTKLVLILIWGYRTDVRNTPSILGQMDAMVRLHNQYMSHSIDGEEYLKGLLNIDRLGLSTASKILYFMNVRIDGHPCVIVDARVESALPVIREFSDIGRGEDVQFYKAVLAKVDELSINRSIPNENIEYFLYSLGIAWDYYMSSIKLREALAADKTKLVQILNEAGNQTDEKQNPDEPIQVQLKVVNNTLGIKYPKGWPKPTGVYLEIGGCRFEAKTPTFNSTKTIRSREIGKYLQEHNYNNDELVNGIMSLNNGILTVTIS